MKSSFWYNNDNVGTPWLTHQEIQERQEDQCLP